MTAALAMALLLSAACGAAAGALYWAWPRRLSAEEWVMHRRTLTMAKASPEVSTGWPTMPRAQLLTSIRVPKQVLASARADLALLRLAGESAPDNEQRFETRLGLNAIVGGAAGFLLLLLSLAINGLAISPAAAVLPVAGALLWPAWSWFKLRRRANQLRAGMEHRLPRLLVAARVLLESGAATPHGALTHVVAIHQDLAADLVREALRRRAVQGGNVEDALEETAQRYGVPSLARLADSFRIGSRHGTPMAQLLGEQSIRLRQAWFAGYRERITRAPVTMTIPAAIFFVMPLLLLILFLIFTPLAGSIGQL
jgi:Flp pilus assembly protein TadB